MTFSLSGASLLPWCYGCGQEDGADLYFVFEGHFHCLQKGAVVGTISPGMLFGILEVFGISDLSQDMRIRLFRWVGWLDGRGLRAICTKSFQNSCRNNYGLSWIFQWAREWWWIIDSDEWRERKHLRKHWWYSIISKSFKHHLQQPDFSTESTSLVFSSRLSQRSDEICKVGVLTRGKLCNLLHDFPGERGKFEELVHNLMEDSVNHHLVPWSQDGKWMWWVKSTYFIRIVEIEVHRHTYNPNSLRYRVDLEKLRQGEFKSFFPCCCFFKSFLVLNQSK